MKSPTDETLEKIRYRHTELDAALPYLTGRGDMTPEILIDIVAAIYDKSSRTFKKIIQPLKFDIRKIVDEAERCVDGLKFSSEYLNRLEIIRRKEGAAYCTVNKGEIETYLGLAVEDTKGMRDCYAGILGMF